MGNNESKKDIPLKEFVTTLGQMMRVALRDKNGTLLGTYNVNDVPAEYLSVPVLRMDTDWSHNIIIIRLKQ